MDNNYSENTPQTEQAQNKDLFRVTTFSKLLALILFITLPFLGFWLGLKFDSPATKVDDKTTASEKETVEGFKNTATEIEAKECLSTSAPKPLYNNTYYSIVYSPKGDIEYSSTFYEGIPPYDEKCKASLVYEKDGVEKIIIDNLVGLMMEQGLSSISGFPKPYIFYTDNNSSRKHDTQRLVFGNNNYEGSHSPIYSLDLETLVFKDLTGPTGDGQIDKGGNPFKLLIPYYDSRLRVLDLNTEKLYETTLSLGESETFFLACGMGCASSVGWIDDENIWYGVYKADNKMPSDATFSRVGSIKFDPATWKEISVE